MWAHPLIVTDCGHMTSPGCTHTGDVSLWPTKSLFCLLGAGQGGESLVFPSGTLLPCTPLMTFATSNAHAVTARRVLLCSCPHLSSSLSVEVLRDLLVGPAVELLLTPREPALPMEAERGGNTSPGLTASE